MINGRSFTTISPYYSFNKKMSHKLKEKNIKNQTYYCFDDMNNIKNLDPTKIKMKNHAKILLFTTLDI